MKKILIHLLSAGLFATISVGSNSCAPTAPSETSATALVSAPSSLALDTANPTGSSAIGLTCGCPFALTVTGYGGDTGVIHFSFGEKLDSSITTHNLNAKIISSSFPAGSDPITAWIGLATPNDSVSPSNRGTLLYDTLHVTATH